MNKDRKRFTLLLLEYAAAIPQEKNGKQYGNNFRRAVIEFVLEGEKL